MTVDIGDFAANEKTGTLTTATMHIFCAAVGAGVLGLPSAMSWLGWIAGPILLTLFFGAALWTSLLLADVYCVAGIEHSRYHHAVQSILGRWGSFWATIFQVTNLVLLAIAYTITASTSMQTIAGQISSSFSTQWQLTCVVAAIELVLSLLPSLEDVWWVSAIGSITSCMYCSIALILGCVYAGNNQGSLTGRGASPSDKAFGILNGLGSMGFAFGFSPVLIEIMDTLKQPPQASKTMKAATNIGITTAFCFYLSVSVTGYSAMGDSVPGNVLTGFKEAPEWVLVIANLAVCIHMLSAFQVFSQPIYDTIESHLKAFAIKRQRRAAGQPTASVEPAGSQAQAGCIHSHSHSSHLSPSDGMAEEKPVDCEGGGVKGAASEPAALAQDSEAPLGCRHMSTSMGSREMSMRESSSGMVVLNSAPIPDLIPQSGWSQPMPWRCHTLHDDPGAARDEEKPIPKDDLARRCSSVVAFARDSMFHVDTGAANEHVPLNEAGYLLPFWQRLVVRSAYVCLICIIAICMPFFTAVVGLVGSVCFFPLSILFPMLMWHKVYQPVGRTLWSLWAVGGFMLLVCTGAVVGSVQSLIAGWSSFEFLS